MIIPGRVHALPEVVVVKHHHLAVGDQFADRGLLKHKVFAVVQGIEQFPAADQKPTGYAPARRLWLFVELQYPALIIAFRASSRVSRSWRTLASLSASLMRSNCISRMVILSINSPGETSTDMDVFNNVSL